MAETKTEHAKEGGHFYAKDGSPFYTIIGKNGKVRATTLRDARTENLCPSVTMLIREANAPGLFAWKENQVIMACLTLPRITDEPEPDCIARIKADAKQHAKMAAERGTLIHTHVQMGFEKQALSAEAYPYFKSACETVEKETDTLCTDWICEKSFCFDGYGGKVDLHISEIVIDIKTTEKPLEDISTYDEHAMQLSAYRTGLGYPKAKCGILYINVLDKSSKLIWIEEDKLQRGYRMFTKLKEFWYEKTGL